MEKDKKKPRCIPTSFLKNLDAFGTNIALAYDKKYEFKSSIGGMFSLIQHLMMGFIVATLIMRMVNRKDINLIETKVRKDQSSENNTASIFENGKLMIGVVPITFSRTNS